MRWPVGRVSRRAVCGVIAIGMFVFGLPSAAAQAEAWSIVPTPNGPDGNGILLGVSCTSSRACTAVGWGTAVPGNGTNLQNTAVAERWNGSSWTSEATPNPPGTLTSVLNAVTCTSATNCEAVGYYLTSDITLALAEHWNGSSWTIQPTPNSPAGDGALLGVSCTSARACTAVGTSNDVSVGSAQVLAEQWDGTAWKVVSTPDPPATQRDTLFGVSCTSPVACTAVGSAGNFVNSQFVGAELAERWNGSSWSIQPTPQLPQSTLRGVSCTSPVACIAVGDVNTLGGSLAERWNGQSWTVQTTPSPARFLASVSCVSSGDCTAVGSANAPATGPLAEQWNGSSWSVQSTPVSLGSPLALLGVSCRKSTFCTAVGYSAGAPGTTLAEVYR